MPNPQSKPILPPLTQNELKTKSYFLQLFKTTYRSHFGVLLLKHRDEEYDIDYISTKFAWASSKVSNQGYESAKWMRYVNDYQDKKDPAKFHQAIFFGYLEMYEWNKIRDFLNQAKETKYLKSLIKEII